MASSYHDHFEYKVKDCMICCTVNEAWAGGDFSPAAEKVELIPVKFFAGWIVEHFSENMQESLFSYTCAVCKKTFRDYLIDGSVMCGFCDANFKPLIRAVLRVMVKSKRIESGRKKKGVYGECG